MNWVRIADLAALPVDRGVAALVGHHPVAVFRLAGDEIYAIDHVDPTTDVPVLARGLVGSVGDRPVVASPLHKARFCLRTGECLDHPGRAVAIWPVDVVDGVVCVGAGSWVRLVPVAAPGPTARAAVDTPSATAVA